MFYETKTIFYTLKEIDEEKIINTFALKEADVKEVTQIKEKW